VKSSSPFIYWFVKCLQLPAKAELLGGTLSLSLCYEEAVDPLPLPPRNAHICSDKVIDTNVPRGATARETLCSILHDYSNRQLGFIRPF
jgi:hypothetical protein